MTAIPDFDVGNYFSHSTADLRPCVVLKYLINLLSIRHDHVLLRRGSGYAN